MQALRRSGLFASILLLVVFLSACGGLTALDPKTTTTTNQATTNQTTANQATNNAAPTAPADAMPAATATATMNNKMDARNMMAAITITPDMGGNMNALIGTGKAMINGQQTSVLLTSKGFPIYYYKPDTNLMATCTGDCAKDWPPVLATQGMMNVTSSMTLPKQLSIHKTANGDQVF